MRPVQKFSKEYLDSCAKMSPAEILAFLESFRQLNAPENRESPSRLISIKIPEDLLRAFRLKAEASGVRYQTQIKKLMEAWLKE